MKKSLITLAVLAVLGMPARARTNDVAFTYRMGAGWAGDVNRSHPVSILPGLNDTTNPVRFIGDPAIINTAASTYRGILASDASDSTAINIHGILMREFPVQAATSSLPYGGQSLGDPVPAPVGPSVLSWVEDGFVLVKVRGAGAVTKNGAVFIFAAANESGHVLGGFENAAIAGKTVPVANARYRGPADANGIAEIQIWRRD